MIHRLQKIFGSKTKAQEILFLLHDAKEVVRQGFYPLELPSVETFCREQKLFLVRSLFKVFLADGKKGDNISDLFQKSSLSDALAYSNKGLRLPVDDSRGLFFVYVSKDEKKAYEAAYAEQLDNHEALGQLLGYPACCIAYFCRHFSEDNPNPEVSSSQILTNISKRKEDLVIISHFPCREACPESLGLGKKYLTTLGNYWPERAEELRQGLALPSALSSTGKKLPVFFQ